MIFMAAAFLNGLVTPSVMVTAPIYGFIYDMTGNYLIVLFILIILLLLAGASSAYGWKHKQRNESETNLQL